MGNGVSALTGPSDDGLGLFYSALDAVLAAKLPIKVPQLGC